MDSGEDLEQDFDSTCEENKFLSDVYRKYETPKHFLQRSEKIFARSTRINHDAALVWLNYVTDIDGCVLELEGVSGFKGVVRHITICNNDRFSLKYVKSVLKKHVNLTNYSKVDLTMFNNCLGTQIFYAEGWECWIGLLPVAHGNKESLMKERIAEITYQYFCDLRLRFKKRLSEYAYQGIARRTLMKNDINNIKKVFVLPDDSAAILRALQDACEGYRSDRLKPVVFCFRFGEKMTNGLDLKSFHREGISNITVHAGIDISCDCGVDLMWSMSGIQEVVGCRGSISTCLSLNDCGNYQSNLDGKQIDLSRDLLDICRFPAQVRFFQMYADVPHCKPSCRVHPVSGLIAGGMIFPKPTEAAFSRDSLAYISMLDSNWSLMTESSCRLEVVSVVDSPSDVIFAADVLNLEKVKELIQKKPLLVPFPADCITCIRELGLWMKNELKGLLEKFARTGNVEASWYAYQLELASEKLLWGRPMCNMSIRHSINLGPGVLGASRSLTDHLGFIALEDWSACLSDEDTVPPYAIWTKSEATGKMLMRAAGLHDVLDGRSIAVVGRRLVIALLKDMYTIGNAGVMFRFGEFLSELKTEKTRLHVVGAITAKSLCDLLEKKKRVALHMVFGSLCRLVQGANMPLIEVLDAGLMELQLKYFPAFQTYDRHGHRVLTWSLKQSFWSVVYTERSVEPATLSTDIYSELVKGELERRGLIFPSKLKAIRGPFPWIACCTRKLQGQNLDEERTITTLAWISCIAFIMQGWFVDYDRLKILTSDLPVKQSRMKSLEILSKLQLAKVNLKGFTLLRLHDSIPHQLPTVQAETSVMKSADNDTEIDSVIDDCVQETTGRIGEEDDIVVTQKSRVERRLPSCVPVDKCKPGWNCKELEILHDVAKLNEKTVSEKYEAYRELCFQEQIPLRTKHAFRIKLNRLTSS